MIREADFKTPRDQKRRRSQTLNDGPDTAPGNPPVRFAIAVNNALGTALVHAGTLRKAVNSRTKPDLKAGRCERKGGAT